MSNSVNNARVRSISLSKRIFDPIIESSPRQSQLESQIASLSSELSTVKTENRELKSRLENQAFYIRELASNGETLQRLFSAQNSQRDSHQDSFRESKSNKENNNPLQLKRMEIMNSNLESLNKERQNLIFTVNSLEKTLAEGKQKFNELLRENERLKEIAEKAISNVEQNYHHCSEKDLQTVEKIQMALKNLAKGNCKGNPLIQEILSILEEQ